MRKELFLAILAGSVLGLILAFGIWRANSVLKTPKNGNKSTAVTATPAADFKIVIAKPLNNQVLGDTPISISGVTKSGAYVVVAGEESDAIATAEKDGKFTIDTNLEGGANQIKVFAFEENGSAAETKLTLVYSTEFARDEAKEEEKTATTSDEIRQKVIEKIQDATKPGIAVYGVVTDITDGTIQIKSQTGEIQQIGFSKDAIFVKTGKTSKTIKSNEVAIGDFIIAMGTKTGNAFTATRVLVTDPLTDSQMKANFGKLTTVGRNKLTIKNPKSEEEITINTNSDTTYTALDTKLKVKKITDLDEGDSIITIGQDLARSVFVVKSAAPTASPSPTPKK